VVENSTHQCKTIREEASGIVVQPEDLQATFENLMCVIREGKEESFSSASVVAMLESVYEWMVFDGNFQVIVPSEPGSSTVRKMWPQGSKIDTRKKKDRSQVESSSRRLKEVDGEYASTVASSVISSTMDEEGTKIRKGSVMYTNRACSTPLSYEQPYMYPGGDYHRPLPLHPSQSQGYNQALFSSHSRAAQPVPPTFVPAPPQSGHRQRYSIVGEPVEPPQPVEETPQMEPAQPVRRRVVKRTKVGASARRPSEREGDEEVTYAN
jgi:hypothetical protein